MTQADSTSMICYCFRCMYFAKSDRELEVALFSDFQIFLIPILTVCFLHSASRELDALPRVSALSGLLGVIAIWFAYALCASEGATFVEICGLTKLETDWSTLQPVLPVGTSWICCSPMIPTLSLIWSLPRRSSSWDAEIDFNVSAWRDLSQTSVWTKLYNRQQSGFEIRGEVVVLWRKTRRVTEGDWKVKHKDNNECARFWRTQRRKKKYLQGFTSNELRADRDPTHCCCSVFHGK